MTPNPSFVPKIELLYPIQIEDVLIRKTRIAQEFGLDTHNMDVHTFFYLSDKVPEVWNSKKESIEKGLVYIGG